MSYLALPCGPRLPSQPFTAIGDTFEPMNLQSSGATALAIPFALICGVIAIAYGAYLIFWVLRQPAGSARMQEIAAAIQEGAMAYMRRQYTTIAVVAIILAIIIGIFLHWQAAVGFLVGAILSGATGFIGMSIAVRANVRTAEAAKGGLGSAFNVAFRGGAVRACSSSASASSPSP